LVGASEEDLEGQIPTQLGAEEAVNGDGLEGKFIPTGGNVAAASLAVASKVLQSEAFGNRKTA
jgi:hypothetical protein